MEKQIALARLDFLVFRIIKVSQQNLVRQGQWPAQPAPDNREIPLHRFVDLGCHFRSRFDRNHIFSPRFSLIVVSAPSGLGERRSERSSPPNGWAARLLNTRQNPCKGNMLSGHHGTLEISALNRLLNEAALFHFFDELVRVGSADRPTFWIADRKHRHHVASRHNTPPW